MPNWDSMCTLESAVRKNTTWSIDSLHPTCTPTLHDGDMIRCFTLIIEITNNSSFKEKKRRKKTGLAVSRWKLSWTQGSSSSPGSALATEMVHEGLCRLTELQPLCSFQMGQNKCVVVHGKPDQTWLIHRRSPQCLCFEPFLHMCIFFLQNGTIYL